MSKELDKFKKTAKPLLKIGRDLVSEYGSHRTNREHHKQILLECAKEVGRRVQVLKQAGQSGTTIDDFTKDKEIQQVAKASTTAIDSLFKEQDRLKKMVAAAKDTSAKITALHKDVEKEIAQRKKKKSRKLLSKDSKSLPDMEALSAELLTTFQNLRDELIMLVRSEGWTAKTETKNFDKCTKQEIAQSGAAREKRDDVELGARGFDVRVIKKKGAVSKKLLAAIKTACADGLKALKAGDPSTLAKKNEEARKYLAGMEKILKPYDAKISTMGNSAIAGMKQDKDGKVVFTSIEAMRDQIKEGNALIKKISRVTV